MALKLSTRARYGLSCMISVARLASPDRPASLDRVSHETGVSKRYLEQLALALKHHGLLNSTSGRHGGYRLARLPESIRLGEIVEATIGGVSVVDCVLHPERCERASSCENRLIYLLINRRIASVLDEYSLADLAERDRLVALCEGLLDDEGREGEVGRLCGAIIARDDTTSEARS